MPQINLGIIDLNDDNAAVFRDCMRPRAQSERRNVKVNLDVNLLTKYEEYNPRTKDGRYSGEGLSNTINKALAAYMIAYGML